MEALPGKVQMINGQRNFFMSETERFVQDLPASSLYTVISIIGPQNSGKSYLLNNLFGTQFDVLAGSKGMRQTTKGIWIAKCSKPCLIIMDVEGMDGKERRDDTLFEKQSALFSLAISDVMILNMWHRDIGRQQGAGLELIKLIFQERVKIEAPITEIIIVVRDHDYDEFSSNVTQDDVQRNLAELWEEVNESTRMSDYIKVTVKDFPHKKEEIRFAQKSKDLTILLRNAAANGTLQQMSHAPSFAFRAEMIWNKILQNERLTAADQQLAMSTHNCHIIKDQVLKSLKQEQDYGLLTSDKTNIGNFNAVLKLFLGRLLVRYDDETRTFDAAIRNEVRAKLESAVVIKTFEPTFNEKADVLVMTMLSKAEAYLPAQLKRLETLKKSAIEEVLKGYGKEFDDASRKDLHLYLEGILAERRREFVLRLTHFAEKKASKIQAERNKKLGALGVVNFFIGVGWAALTTDISLAVSAAGSIATSVASTCAFQES